MKHTPTLWLGTCLVVLAVACSQATAEDEPDAEIQEGRTVDLVGSIELEPTSGKPGATVTVSGSQLPASTDFDLVWVSADGAWVLQGDRQEEYHGRVHNPVEVELGAATTDGSGFLNASFEVPEGFGFAHDVLLVDSEGVVRNKALFDVEMEVTVTPTSGPIGTPITIEVIGMGYQTLENTRTIVYDNLYVGFLSAVTTNGTARAVIPATGNVGPHQIGIWRGAYTFPYLNPQQSPRPDIPTFETTFTVTEGDPVLPEPIEAQNPPPITRSPDRPTSGTWITTDLESGPVGTEFLLAGGGFDSGDEVELIWYRVVGNRVGGQGWDEMSVPLGTVTANTEGAWAKEVVAPGDVGGPHRIEAKVSGDVAAEVDFSISPAIESVTPSSGPWGTEITIIISGVGWTETANIYTLVYDNSYLGYACGFNSQGDVEITLTAVGEPGWHFIDLYPAIYKGKESPGQQNFRLPQLTYADDHPGEDLPAFHLAFFLEDE